MVNKGKLRTIIVAGYAWSGSSALIDLLKEFQSYKLFEPEFRLITDPGGIMDLENALIDNRSYINVNLTIKRFMRLVTIYGREFHWSRLNISKIFSKFGFNYNQYMNNQFNNLSKQYIQKLIDLKYRGALITDYYELDRLSFFLIKLRFFFLKNLGRKGNKAKTIYFSAPKYDYFLKTTQNYLYSLCEEISKNSQASNIILNQAIQPSNINKGLKYFRAPKSVIVDRDPRDIFSEINKLPHYTSVPIEKVDDYINWFRLNRSWDEDKKNENVLRIKFEELILSYQETVDKVIKFLGEDSTVHKYNKKYFNPAISIKNVGLWKNYPFQDHIRKIAEELDEFCWNV